MKIPQSLTQDQEAQEQEAQVWEKQEKQSIPERSAWRRNIAASAEILGPLPPGRSRRPAMRIAIFGSRGIPHTSGGAEAFLEERAPRLAERGHQVTVYCRRSLFQSRPR